MYNEFNKIIYFDGENIITKFQIKKTPYNLNKIKPHTFELYKSINTSPGYTNLNSLCFNYRAEDIAATAEKFIKDFLLMLINKYKKSDFLLCTGGLFNNVSFNQELLDNSPYKNIFFSMAPGDSGLSLGMALHYYRKSGHKLHDKYQSKYGITPYLGPSFSSDDIEDCLKTSTIKYIRYNDYTSINHKLVKLLIDNQIIGVFRSRAEIGPRSLGNRSILANPANPIAKSKVNQYVKKRDWFMPFAPAVIDEKFKLYFNERNISLYMQIAPIGNNKFKYIAPSAVHVDGTSRVQYVSKKFSPEFHDLIKKFGDITGCYSLLNTSFNRHGIATIASPKQAIEHLLDGVIDYLVIDNYLISLKENRLIDRDINLNYIDEKKLLDEMNINIKEKLNKL